MRWNRSRWVPRAWATRRLDGVGVGHRDDRLARMARRPARRGCRRCGSASRRTTRRSGSGTRSGSAGPCATPGSFERSFSLAPVQSPKSHSSRPAVDLHLEAARRGDGRGGLPGPLERRGVDRGDVLQGGDAVGGGLGLGLAGLREVEAGGASGQRRAGRRGLPVTHEEHERGARGSGLPGHERVHPTERRLHSLLSGPLSWLLSWPL